MRLLFRSNGRVAVLGLLWLSAFGPGPNPAWAGTNSAPTWPKAEPQAIRRWQARRFGMFIHFGPVSLTGHEISWSRGTETPISVYDNLYRRFDPTNFDARQWVAIAKAAGMKYVVLTAKHHDGFCLWDTRFTDYNIMHTPFHRDIVGELSKACRKAGIPFGTYYSTCDWHNPDFPLTSPGGTVRRATSDLDAYNRYLLNQIRELIVNYGPLITIWNDVPQMFQGRGARTIALARSLQPDILINDRTGDGGDYETPEQRVGKYQEDHPWETCMTLCQQWSWKPNDKLKSLDECLRILVSCAGGDGNLLLNVGPMPDGRIEPRQVERLQEIGAWLRKNGQSIYNTRGGPWTPTSAYASTRRGNTIYLHVLHWHGDTLELPDIPRDIRSASVLHGGRVELTHRDGQLRITVPAARHHAIDTIVKLKLWGSAMTVPALTPPRSVKQATASNVFQHQTQDYGPQCAFDRDPGTRWATDSGTRQAWIAADLGRVKTVHGVRVDEAFPGRVQKFELQYRAGAHWRTIFAGARLGSDFQREFSPVKAQEFRLNILDATDGPTINEIELEGE